MIYVEGNKNFIYIWSMDCTSESALMLDCRPSSSQRASLILHVHDCSSKWILNKYLLINIYYIWPCSQPHNFANTAIFQRMKLKLSVSLLKKTLLAHSRTRRGNLNWCLLAHQQCTVHDTRYLPHARIHISLSIITISKKRETVHIYCIALSGSNAWFRVKAII